MPMTKIIMEDLEGNVVHEVEMDIGADTADPDSSDWPGAIVWNNRVFTSVSIPDCDAPDQWQTIFSEVGTLLFVAGGKDAMANQLELLARRAKP